MRGFVVLILLLVPLASLASSLQVPVGSSIIVSGVGINQVAVGNPAVLDIQPVSTSEVLVTGLAVGSTQVFVWDKFGRHQYGVNVVVSEAEAKSNAKTIALALSNAAVTVEPAGDKVILRGTVASEDEKLRCETVAKAIYPKIDNLLVVRPGASQETIDAIKAAVQPFQVSASLSPDGKVLISGAVENLAAVQAVRKAVDPWRKDVQLVFALTTARSIQEETLESLTRAYAKWNIKGSILADGRVMLEGTVPNKEALDQVESMLKSWPAEVGIVSRVAVAGATQLSQVLISARVVEIDRTRLKDIGVDWSRIVYSQSESGNVTYSAEDQPFIIGQGRPGPFPIFGGPPIAQLDPIGARVSALIQKKQAKLLSQPSLVTTSGSKANILIGGEIPIPVPQAGIGGAGVVTIEYKTFGISLDVVPTVGDECEIALQIRPEVSALDYANGIILSGFAIPAIRTRRAEATVHVRSGCSIAIGGLISTDDIKDVKAIPLLSSIPILGNFFKDVSTQKRNSELLIIVTPELVTRPQEADLLKNVGPTPDSIAPECIPPPAPECAPPP